MKRYLPFFIAGVILVAGAALFAFTENDTVEKKMNNASAGEKVEIFYFHLTRRCVTCQAVEKVAGDAVRELYPDEIASGLVIFRSMNIEDKANESDAERVKAVGQCLLVVSGDTRIDLTSSGFLYARTKPEKLRDELKNAIDPLLKPGE